MSTELPPVVLFDPLHHASASFIDQMAQIHADCVLQDGTLATYLPDPTTGEMDMEVLRNYWTSTTAEAGQHPNKRVIALQFAPRSESDSTLELAGYGGLYMPGWQTGPFRSSIEKLLVSPRHRRKGIARRVMAKLEDVAREKNAGLIMLDTTIGSGAELVYPRLGYKVLCRVPRYGVSPVDGRLVDEIFYIKDLRDETPKTEDRPQLQN